jgi:hypothetical protein
MLIASATLDAIGWWEANASAPNDPTSSPSVSNSATIPARWLVLDQPGYLQDDGHAGAIVARTRASPNRIVVGDHEDEFPPGLAFVHREDVANPGTRLLRPSATKRGKSEKVPNHSPGWPVREVNPKLRKWRYSQSRLVIVAMTRPRHRAVAKDAIRSDEAPHVPSALNLPIHSAIYRSVASRA